MLEEIRHADLAGEPCDAQADAPSGRGVPK